MKYEYHGRTYRLQRHLPPKEQFLTKKWLEDLNDQKYASLQKYGVKDFRKIFKALMYEIVESMINHGGVYIKRLGYFAIWMTPAQYYIAKPFNNHVVPVSTRTNRHIFRYRLFSNLGTHFKGWMLDRGVRDTHKKALYKALIDDDLRPKLYYKQAEWEYETRRIKK